MKPAKPVPELYTRHRLALVAPGEPLFAALAAAIPGLSRHLARETVMAGLVEVDGAVVREAKHPLGPSHAVVVDLSHGVRKVVRSLKHGTASATAVAKPFTIVLEDADLVVVDKAPGVLSAPTHAGEEKDHVPALLRAHWRRMGREVGFIGLIHRLDNDTSGCLAFALTRQGQRLLAAQFAGHAATRTYRCLVAGTPRRDSGTITAKLGRGRDGRRTTVDDDDVGKDAVTHWKVLRRHGRGAELEVTLETGRTHQIRVHLAEAGMPVLGDRVYGPRQAEDRARLPKAPRLMLHAWQLAVDHPRSGKRVIATAPMPAEFAEVARLLDADAPPAPAPVVRPLRPERADHPQRADEPKRIPDDGRRRGGKGRSGPGRSPRGH
jgi:23S rRNA pseudouridine1911/1915/1917 synthase